MNIAKDHGGDDPLNRLRAHTPRPEVPEWATEPSPPETRGVWADIRGALPSGHFTADTTQASVKAGTLQAVAETARGLGYGLAQFNGAFRMYTGTHWLALGEDALKRELIECAEAMGYPRDLARGTTLPEGLLKVAGIDLTDAGAPSGSGGSAARVNFPNGTLHIDGTGKARLRDHTPADRLTYCLPYDYDPEATCPQFDAFLAEVQRDPKVRRLLAEVFGAAFAGVNLEKVAFLYGGGANGKSVLTDVVGAALGRENVGSRSLADLVAKETHRLDLAGKLLNVCPEVGNGKSDAPAFKLLASREPITARRLYRDPIEIRDYARLVFNANRLPQIAEVTGAYFRRLLIIPFDYTVPADRRDPELAARIIVEELPGVLNWILAGAKRLCANGRYSECAAADAALAEYQREGDSVRAWLDDTDREPDSGEWVKLSELHEAYKLSMSLDNARAVGSREFSRRLKVHGYAVKRRSDGRHVGVSVCDLSGWL